MWIPLLKREFEHGSLISWQDNRASATVLGLFDLPRHAIGAEKYLQAQRSQVEAFKALQRDSRNNQAVGLQGEFWEAYEEHRQRKSKWGSQEVEAYLSNGGFGIVAALLSSETPVTVFPLEPGYSAREFQGLVDRATRWMSDALELEKSMLATFEESVRRADSGLLRDLLWKGEEEGDPSLGDLIEAASTLGIPVPKEITFAEKHSRIGASLDISLIERQKEMLRQEIRAMTLNGAIPHHAALELNLYESRMESRGDPETRGMLDSLRAKVYAGSLETPDYVVHRMAQAINTELGDYLGSSFRQTADMVDGDHRGSAEVAIRMLELARILGIDLGKYAPLCRYAYHVNLYFSLQRRFRHAVTSHYAESVRSFEGEILRAAAATEKDRRLLALLPAMHLLRELAAYRVEYDSVAINSIKRLDMEKLAKELDFLAGTGWGGDWQPVAARLNGSRQYVLDFQRAGIQRGKAIGNQALSRITSQALDWVIIACDGYLHPALRNSLGSDVNHVFLAVTY